MVVVMVVVGGGGGDGGGGGGGGGGGEGGGGEGRENISLHVIYFSSLDGCLIQFISAKTYLRLKYVLCLFPRQFTHLEQFFEYNRSRT